MNQLKMYIVSDSIGETGDLVAKAAISQFRKDFESTAVKRIPHVESTDQLHEITEIAAEQHAIVLYTLVKEEMRTFLKQECDRREIPSIDLLGPIIDVIGDTLNEQSSEEPGRVRLLDEDYFRKIEAIEFAVKYDDGRDPRGLLLADIVLIGVSRTSKTPLSQYLAHKRYKVANVPLVPEVEPPEELFKINPDKCFGLVISPEKLNSIRKERLKALGLKDDANYARIERIQAEIEHFYSVANRIGCRIIDVSDRAVEETANIILNIKQNREH